MRPCITRLSKPGRLPFCNVRGRWWLLPVSLITWDVAKCRLSNSLISSSFINQNTPKKRTFASTTWLNWIHRSKARSLFGSFPSFAIFQNSELIPSCWWKKKTAETYTHVTCISLRLQADLRRFRGLQLLLLIHISFQVWPVGAFSQDFLNSFDTNLLVFDAFLALARCFLFLTSCFRLVPFPAPGLESAVSPRLLGSYKKWKMVGTKCNYFGKKIIHCSTWIILEVFWCLAVGPFNCIYVFINLMLQFGRRVPRF